MWTSIKLIVWNEGNGEKKYLIKYHDDIDLAIRWTVECLAKDTKDEFGQDTFDRAEDHLRKWGSVWYCTYRRKSNGNFYRVAECDDLSWFNDLANEEEEYDVIVDAVPFGQDSVDMVDFVKEGENCW